jgi:hypothetical protein
MSKGLSLVRTALIDSLSVGAVFVCWAAPGDRRLTAVDNDTTTVTLEVPVYRADRGLAGRGPTSTCSRSTFPAVRSPSKATRPDCRGLAVQLLSLVGSDVPRGYAHDLDDFLPAVLEPGSVPLVLLRTLGL